MVWLSTSLWRWIGSCSRRSAGSSGRKCSARPVSTRNHSPAAGASTTISLSSSSRIRSADTIARRVAALDDGGDELGHRRQAVAGDEPGRPQHPQRVVVEADLRRQRRAQRRRGQVGGAAVRVDQRGVDAASPGSSSRAIALIVKSRRAEVGLDVVGERDVRLARVVGVGLASGTS